MEWGVLLALAAGQRGPSQLIRYTRPPGTGGKYPTVCCDRATPAARWYPVSAHNSVGPPPARIFSPAFDPKPDRMQSAQTTGYLIRRYPSNSERSSSPKSKPRSGRQSDQQLYDLKPSMEARRLGKPGADISSRS